MGNAQLALLPPPPRVPVADANRVLMRWTCDAGDVGFEMECPACGYTGWFSRRTGVACDQCAVAMRCDADIDGPHRYSLTREWLPERRPMVVIGVNPSTADATTNDPTIRRCLGFAYAAGCGSLVMVNLFAWRATDVRELGGNHGDVVGPRNDAALLAACQLPRAIVVAAWGSDRKLPPWHQGRPSAVVAMLARENVVLHVLDTTKDGQPAHPLYLPATCTPMRWL